MALDLGFMYAIVAFMAMVSNIIILNRTLATKYKATIDKWLCVLLSFFVVFCFVDGMWGLFFSRSLWINRIGLTIFTYGFHSMAALSAFMWAGYLLHYLNVQGTFGKLLNAVRWSLIVCQLYIVYSNIFTHKSFIINENAEYITLGTRTTMFLFQFSYYVMIGVFVIGKICLMAKEGNSKRKENNKYFRALIFSVTPLVMGIAQLIYPDGRMYSLGFMQWEVTENEKLCLDC